MDTVIVYNWGLCAASACCAWGATEQEIEAAVNEHYPTGVGRWVISKKPFRTGEPNPCPCDLHPNTRKHVLLNC